MVQSDETSPEFDASGRQHAPDKLQACHLNHEFGGGGDGGGVCRPLHASHTEAWSKGGVGSKTVWCSAASPVAVR